MGVLLGTPAFVRVGTTGPGCSFCATTLSGLSHGEIQAGNEEDHGFVGSSLSTELSGEVSCDLEQKAGKAAGKMAMPVRNECPESLPEQMVLPPPKEVRIAPKRVRFWRLRPYTTVV